MQTTATAYAWYSILHFAYPERTKWKDILAGYAVSVALNTILPANLGTLVFLIMVTDFLSISFAAVLGAYAVEKIFFTVAGAFTYLYLFFSIGGSFDISFSWVHKHPAATICRLRRRHPADRAARAPLLAARGRVVGQGEGGWRDPRPPRRLLRARVPALVRELVSPGSLWSPCSSTRTGSRSASTR